METEQMDILNKNRLVEIKNLNVTFKTLDGNVKALDDVNLELVEGEILGIIGESGSGKSTTALALLGLLAENSIVEGEINYLDKEIINSKEYPKSEKLKRKYRRDLDQRLSEIRWKEISMIFQGAMNAFNPVHTIRNQIEEVFEIHGTFADLSKFSEKDYIDEDNLRAAAYEMALQEISDSEKRQIQNRTEEIFKSLADEYRSNLKDMGEKQKQEYMEQNDVYDSLRDEAYKRAAQEYREAGDVEDLDTLKGEIFNNLLQELKAKLPGMSDKEKRKLLIKNRIEESCRLAGFSRKFLDSYPHELSGGMRQRGIIAMALALHPRIVIADEPTTGLDVITQAKIIKELKILKENRTIKSMIVISHDVGVVSQLANFVAVMYAGRIMEYGEPKDIFLKPKNPYTYALMRSYPSLEQTKTRIKGIPGSVPDMIDPPKGCYFAERCFMAKKVCFETKPEIKKLDNDHYSLCHFDSIDEDAYKSFMGESPVGESSSQNMREESLIETSNLTKFFTVHSTLSTNLFGGANKPVVHAVDGVNISIPRSSILGVVGESGSGKTTLGRLLVDSIPPTDGEIKFKILKDNKEKVEIELTKVSRYSSDYRIFRKEAQLIFQDPFDSINPKMSIFDIVAEPLSIQREEIKSRRRSLNSQNEEDFDVEKEVMNALSIANLRPPEKYAERFPHELSGGERQRVSIARAITLSPSFLVADEPISMLDVSIRANIMNLLIELKETRGISVLYISHDIASARYVSDYIIVMYLGQILEFGKSEDVVKNPLHPYTKALISAVPSVDPTWVNKNLRIVGEIGNAINPTKGCRFYGRCVFRKDVCIEEDPPVQKVGERYYLCHFQQEELTLNEIMKDEENLEEGDLAEEK